MYRKMTVVPVLLLCFVLAGCGSGTKPLLSGNPAYTATIPGTSIKNPDASSTASAPEATPAATPFDQTEFDKLSFDEKYPVRRVKTGISPTTGLPFNGAYHPIMVQMSTDPNALPHWGISQADIVYEAINYSGGKTRLSCIFNDHMPAHVGSIRSVRVHHIDIWSEWRAALVYWGGQDVEGTDAISYLKSLKPDSCFNGLTDSTNLYRDHSRKAPHNGCTDLDKLAVKLADKPSPATRSFLFDQVKTTDGTDVAEFVVNYSKNYRAGYVYDAAVNTYTRYYNRTVQKDGNNGQIVTCANIIVQKVPLSFYDGNGNRPVMELYGSGACEVYTDGKCIKGKWYRPDKSHRTVYTDELGREVALTPGVTFIQIVTPKMETEIIR